MTDDNLLVLGLESSCDDTAAAVLRVSTESDTEILSSIVSGQTDLHKRLWRRRPRNRSAGAYGNA